VTFQFTTSVNGVPTALAGSPAISVYGSNSSTPITAGVSFTGSYNSTTGLNNVAIAATTGNGYAVGIDYSVVITTGTLAGVSMVGYQVGTFSINLSNDAYWDGQAISAAAGVTVPSSIASPTNITAGTITTVTNLTNAAGAGDLTSTMKASVTAAVPTVAAIQSGLATPTNITAGTITSVTNAVAITSNKKKNTASNGFTFLMTSATTGLPLTGLTVASQVSLDGGAFGSTTNSVTELADGVYVLNLSAADTNGNHVMLQFTATGANQLDVEIITQP